MKDFRAVFTVFALVVLVGLAIFVVWRALSGGITEKTMQNAENPLPASENSRPSNRTYPSFRPENKQKEVVGGFDPLADMFDPDTIVESISPILPALPESSESAKKKEDAAVAENLFPKYYTTALVKMQDAFIKAGWMSEDARTPLDSEEHVFAALRLSVDVAAKNSVYKTEAEAKAARHAVEVIFPAMWESERELYRLQKKSALKFFKGNMLGLGDSKDRLVEYSRRKQDFLARFFNAIAPKEALAQVSGTWSAAPTCYKALNPQNTLRGSNLPWPLCCNCGLFCSYGCTYYQDCLINSVLCNVPLGCLNLVCDGFWNAIWDGPYEGEIPVDATDFAAPAYSFACGCDSPQN